MSFSQGERLSYLLTIDAIRNIQRWWRIVAPSMRDTYKCPVCINMHPVSKAVAGFSCTHIMCSICHEAWERQCRKENRASTCPTCRASRISSRPDRDDYDRTTHFSSTEAGTTAEMSRNALQNTYMNSDGYLQDDMLIHHAPTIRRMMRDTNRISPIHTSPHSISRDTQDFISMQTNEENITNTLNYTAIQRAVMNSNNIEYNTSIGYY